MINHTNQHFSINRLPKNVQLHIRNTYNYLHRKVSSSLSHAILSFCILIHPSYPFLMCLCVGPTRPYLSYLCTCSTIHFIFWIGFFGTDTLIHHNFALQFPGQNQKRGSFNLEISLWKFCHGLYKKTCPGFPGFNLFIRCASIS